MTSHRLILLLAAASLCAPTMADALGRKRITPPPSQAVLEARAAAAQAKAHPVAGPQCDQAPTAPLAAPFPYDEAGLTEPGRTAIAQAALWARCHPNGAIVVRGSADNHGSADYQKALAAKRVEAVRGQLGALGATATAIAGPQVPEGALLIEARGQGW